MNDDDGQLWLSNLQGTSMGMTRIPNVPDRSDVKPGMAHFAGTSDVPGASCGVCVSRGYWRDGKPKANRVTGLMEDSRIHTGGCKMFLTLTNKHGPAVSPNWKGCKYFQRKVL